MNENGIPMINIVRRQEQIELLKKENGAKYVLNSTDPNFDKDLYDLSVKLNCIVAIECVAGDTTGRVM
jgi:NADPH:quinone reductase